MYSFFQYIRFLFRSTNQHGIHSPFIYGYVTKCLYQKQPVLGPKAHQVLFKSIPYLKVRKILLYTKTTALQQRLSEKYPFLIYEGAPYDLIYIEADQMKVVQYPTFFSHYCHNGTLILIKDIHKNSSIRRQWKLLCNRQEISVSIDFFYCGALFLRKEQVKQHFTIRI